MDDRISVLPDEIVFPIVSRLTMKEAARTSVLSHRWENLWKYFTGSLDFDGSKTMACMRQEMKVSLETERAKYINWVNKVLNLHQGQDIIEFRVCFDLDKNYAYIIDEWINFAVGKRVRRLKLDLLEYAGVNSQHYTLSLSLLHVLNLSSLTSIRLRKVAMTDEVLSHLLSTCPFIEELSLTESKSLVSVKIASAIKLKRLELMFCMSLQYVMISAINLVSFKYFGPCINNPFENVPLLSEVSVGGPHWVRVVANPLSYLSGVLNQLETLTLRLDFQLSYSTRHFSEPETEAEGFALRRGGKPREEGRNGRLECLKVVEIAGWVGNTSDTEFALNLLEKVVSLDKIIIDPSRQTFAQRRVSNCWPAPPNELAGARERAKLLETKLPPGTGLVIR